MKTIGRIGCAVSFFEHEEFELTRIIFTALQIREEDNTDNNDNIRMTEVMSEKKKVVHVVLSCLKILYSLDE